MLNVVAIMGRLVRDPELKTTQQGTSVCSFTIACDRSFAQKGEERKADFITVTAWRQTAEFVCKYFSKGSLIAIEGSLQTRQYQDKNGNNRTAVEVVANHINFAGAKSSDKPAVQGFDQQTASYVREANAAQNAPAPPAPEMIPTEESTPFDPPPEPAPEQTTLQGAQIYPDEQLSDYAPQPSAQPATGLPANYDLINDDDGDLPF